MKRIYDYSSESAKLNEGSYFIHGNYRIAVIMPELIRIEIANADGEFTDLPTQGVWKRNFTPVWFEKQIEKDFIRVDTHKISLKIDLNNIKDSTVTFKNGKTALVYNDQNLHGTYRTLDTYDGYKNKWTEHDENEIGGLKLGDGVISRAGVAVLDDSKSLILIDDKTFERKECTDIYLFAFGHDYRGAVNAFYQISGKVPLIPRKAFGNWWSRYHAYTQQEYINLMQEFEDREIPLSVATVDMDWHYVDLTKSFGFTDDYYQNEDLVGAGKGWTGYTWDKDLFPDYKAFLKELKKRNLMVTLNLHPADGVRFFEEQYEQFAKAMGIDPKTKQRIYFDITNDTYIENYFKLLHHPYQKDGVDFWWMDWQQGTNSKMQGLDPLWMLNHLHYKDNAQNSCGLFLSRYCGAGAHRYPLGFSGDTHINWEVMNYIPYFTATASNIGYTWWSHDIGAHFGGYKDDELAIRWVQFGVFSPINRLHSTRSQVMGKEPWRYLGQSELIMEKWLKLRHELIPYIYTYSHLTHEKGKALIEPLYYTYPEEKRAYSFINEYFFGDSMLVCPITSKGKKGLSTVKAFIPSGVYTDFFTGQVYRGKRTATLVRDLKNMPVLVKAGSIIPLSKQKGNGTPNPESMKILVCSGNGKFNMIEDNENGAILNTVYKLSKNKNSEKLTISCNGDKAVAPLKRELEVSFANVIEGEVVSVTENGKPIDFKVTRNNNLKVFFTHNGGKVEVEIQSTTNSLDSIRNPLQNAKRYLVYALERVNYSNDFKTKLFQSLMQTQSVSEYKNLIKQAPFSAYEKLSLFENLLV